MIDFYKVKNNVSGSSKNIDYTPTIGWINRNDWANTQVGGMILAESHDDELVTLPEGSEIFSNDLINKMVSPKKVDKRKYNNKIRYYRSSNENLGFGNLVNTFIFTRLYVSLSMRSDVYMNKKKSKNKYKGMEFYENTTN